MNMEKVIINTEEIKIFDFLKDNETEEEAIQRATEFYTEDLQTVTRNYNNGYDPEYWQQRIDHYKAVIDKGFKVIDYYEFAKLEREKLLSDELQEITEENFNEALDVLPPLKLCTIDGIEMFCMREMYTGTYTTQYAHDKETGKFYCKMVDCADRTTWINNILKINKKENNYVK